MTALTLNGSAAAASTLAAAGKLFNATGGTSGNTSTKVGTSTQFKQIFALGTATNQTGVASIPAPTDSNWHGWMWDVTTLEGQEIAAGTWTPTIHLLASTSITVTPTVEWYKRSSGGVYTSIGSVAGSSIALTTSSQALTFTPPSLALMDFATGDKLMMWLWVNQTAGGATNSTISVVEATSGSSAGVISEAQAVTPGYAPVQVALSKTMAGVGTLSGTLTVSGMLVLYGSNVADTTLTTACQMATTSGGIETSNQTTWAAGGTYGEILSQGGTSIASFSAVQSPTGHGWVYSPGAGTFALGNWSALCAFLGSDYGSSNFTLRFSKRTSGGTYTTIGSIVTATGMTLATRTVFMFAATSMASVTFSATDQLYIDVWFQDTTGSSGDHVAVYESTSATAGVINDFQITTSEFSIPLADTLSGAGTLTGVWTLGTALASTESGGGTLSGTITETTVLAVTLVGVGTLSATLTHSGGGVALSGTGTGAGVLSASLVRTYTANSGDNLSTMANALLAGDTLILNDGTYSTSPGLNVAGIHGTTLAPITIKAANDGQAIIDGGGTFPPIFLTNCSYVTLQGIHAKNSSSNVVYLFSGTGGANGPLDHITLQRISAHGAANGNWHAFDISQDGALTPPSALTNILVEDCAAWGPGRYMFSAYHADTVIFRRCFGYWNTITNVLQQPRAAFNVYGSKNVNLENCIGQHAIPYQTETFNNYFVACWQTSDDPTNYPTDNTKVLGCIFYNNWDGWWVADTSGSSLLFQDSYFESPSNAATWTTTPKGDAIEFDDPYIGSATIKNCVFRNSVLGFNKRNAANASTLTIQNNAFLGNTTAMANDPGHSYCGFYGNGALGTSTVGTDTISNPNYDTTTYGRGGTFFLPAGSPYIGTGVSGTDIGAHIIYQYVNGVLTGTTLWPWPMEGRIVAELGLSPTYTSGVGPWITLAGVYGPGQLIVTINGVGTLNGVLSSSGVLAVTINGNGAFVGGLSATLQLTSITLAGTGTLTSTPTLSTALIDTISGVGSLTPLLTASSVLTSSIPGVGTLAGTAGLAISLTDTLAGRGVISGVLGTTAPVALSGTLSGVGALGGAPVFTIFETGTFIGAGTLSGAVQLATSVAGSIPGTGTLSGALAANVLLPGIILPGVGILAGTIVESTVLVASISGVGTLAGTSTFTLQLATVTMAGIGTLGGVESLGTVLASTLAGVGVLTGAAPTFKTALTSTMVGIGQLSGVLTGAGALVGTCIGTSTMVATFQMSASLAASVNGAGTFTGILHESTTLTTALVGSGIATFQVQVQTAIVASASGMGMVAFTLFLSTTLTVTLSGTGMLTGTTSKVTALSVMVIGMGRLTPTFFIGGVLVGILAAHSTTSAALSFPGPSATATWVIRDLRATWVARDLADTWKTRR